MDLIATTRAERGLVLIRYKEGIGTSGCIAVMHQIEIYTSPIILVKSMKLLSNNSSFKTYMKMNILVILVDKRALVKIT